MTPRNSRQHLQEDSAMSPSLRGPQAIVREWASRYRKSVKHERSPILDQVHSLYQYDRVYAARALRTACAQGSFSLDKGATTPYHIDKCRWIGVVTMDPVAIFKALGQPQRYALFLDLLQAEGTSCCADVALGESACCVIDFTQRHHLAQSTISHHLQVLADAKLVTAERRGTYRVYQVNQPIWESFQRHVAGLMACVDSDDRAAIGKVPYA